VHLHEQIAAGGKDTPNAFRVDHGLRAGYPTSKEILVGFEAEVAEALVARIGILGVHGRCNTIDVHTEDGVVGDGAIAGPHLEGPNGHVLFKTGGQDEDLVLVGHVTFVGVGLGHAEHQIGIAHLAAVRKLGQSGVVCRVALQHTAVHPGADRLDFISTQYAFPHEMAVFRIWRPRRHVADGGHVLDEGPIGGHFVIGREGHGTDFTRSVAFCAGVVDDRGHIGVVGDLRGERRAAEEEYEGVKTTCHHGLKVGAEWNE